MFYNVSVIYRYCIRRGHAPRFNVRWFLAGLVVCLVSVLLNMSVPCLFYSAPGGAQLWFSKVLAVFVYCAYIANVRCMRVHIVCCLTLG